MTLSSLILLLTTLLVPSSLAAEVQSWFSGQLQVSAPSTICSLDYGATITLNSDGNLAIFRTPDPATIAWNAEVSSPLPGSTLYFLPDGNLAIFDANSVPLWSSGTAGKGAQLACFYQYPYLEIFDATGRLIWFPRFNHGQSSPAYTMNGCPHQQTEPWLCVG
ncbi:MAG: hypothetical protein Q9222_005719 [Ikaeria aurantiellina]